MYALFFFCFFSNIEVHIHMDAVYILHLTVQ